MAYSAIEFCNRSGTPIYFHRVGENEKTLEEIAANLGVDIKQINHESAASQPQPGDIVVVNLR